MSSKESLQIAQILADLDSLHNTDHNAACALLAANKTLSQSRSLRRKSRQNSLPNRPKFDSRESRVVGTGSTPSISRMSSNLSSMSGGSAGNGGGPMPLNFSLEEEDPDLRRARELTSLYEMRGKFKQMGDTGLGRAKERVDRVVEKYAKKELDERERVAKARHLGVSSHER